MKIKRILAIFLCLSLLFAMSALTSCKKEDEKETALSAEEQYRNLSAEQKFTTSLIKAGESVENWEDVAAITKVMGTAAQSGSIQLQVNMNKAFTGRDQDLMLDAKLWADGAKYALNANASYGNDQLSANAYIDPAKKIIVESDQILGGAYGVDMTTLLSDLSALAAEEEDATEILASITEVYNEYMKIVEKLPEMMERGAAFAEKERDQLLAIIIENTSITSEEKTISSMDREINATCITLHIDNVAVANILSAYFNAIKNNAELGEYLEGLASLMALSDDGKEPAEGEKNESVADRLLKGVEEEINELVDDIKEADPFEVLVVISTDSVGSIVRVDVELEIDEVPVKASLEYAEDNHEFGGLRLTVVAQPKEGVTMTVTLNILVEKTEKGKTISFNTTGLSALAGCDFAGTIEYTNESGRTKIHLDQILEGAGKTELFEASFIYKISNGTFVFGDLSLKVGGVNAAVPYFMLTIKEQDTMPTAPQSYTNILRLNEAQLKDLAGKAETAIIPFADLFDDEK